MRDKILITGATGFVGQNLIPNLEKADYKVGLITRFELVNCAENRINGNDIIIHLAGKAHDMKKTAEPNVYYEVNYEITKKLYDAFLKSDAKKFLFISSVKAVADSIDGILTESTTPDPKTDYGISKLMAENYICSQPLPEGKSYYILRPCMIHGPGNKGNLNLLHKFVQKGIPYPLAAFKNKRSFLSVYNFCFVIKQLIANDVAFGIYNIADDEALSTNEVVQVLSSSLGKTTKLWSIPTAFIKFIAGVGDKIKLPLNTERLNKLTENYVVSNSKIKSAINTELPLTAREGLMTTAESFNK